MKIICTKFRQPSTEERQGQPDPFRGFDHDTPSLESTLARQYTSFGPSLDDHGAGVSKAVASMIATGWLDPPVVERALYEWERDEKEEKEREKKREEEAKARSKHVKEKHSVPHSLQIFGGGGSGSGGGSFEAPTTGGTGKSLQGIAERRPSLPQLNTKTSGSSLFGNMTPSASIGGLPFSSIFKDSRKKRKEEKMLTKATREEKRLKKSQLVLESLEASGFLMPAKKDKGKGVERQVKSDGQIPEEVFVNPFVVRCVVVAPFLWFTL
jgi:hypothetical protein